MSKRVALLVDDEQLVLESLRLQIRRLGHDALAIECANSASEAWEVIEELQGEGAVILVIISDWLMPAIRGDAFLEEVKARFPGITRVMLTGQADGEALQRVSQQGVADMVLFKPWSDRDLAEALKLAEPDAGSRAPGA